MIVNALQGKPLPVYGDGSNIRDWLYVEDHVRAIDLVLRKGRVGETYNVGGNEEHSNIDIVKGLCAAIDGVLADRPELQSRYAESPVSRGKSTESLITYVKDRPGHDWRYAIDASKLEGELGFRPAHTFATGLEDTINWVLDNEAWWQAVLDDSYRDWMDQNYARR
jgi:dTDP-glucose 4,6-dehydratase